MLSIIIIGKALYNALVLLLIELPDLVSNLSAVPTIVTEAESMRLKVL